MSDRRPRKLERLVERAVFALNPDESGRNSWGVRWFKWVSPSPEIEALWLSVTARDVTLSCKVAHKHFELNWYRRQKLTNLRAKRRVAHEALQEAAHFLRGEIAVAQECDAKGNARAAMWCRRTQLPEAITRSKELASEPLLHQAWTWSGPLQS